MVYNTTIHTWDGYIQLSYVHYSKVCRLNRMEQSSLVAMVIMRLSTHLDDQVDAALVVVTGDRCVRTHHQLTVDFSRQVNVLPW